jgi:phosphohistidine swiveling domain-containing protein
MKAKGRKRTYYGVPIGILMLDSKFERFNGDIGNAQTWPFPVQYKIVRGAVPNKVVDTLNNRDLLQHFLDAADELIADGVDGITTTCGFLALYQQDLAAHCSVPIATSALLQVPMVARVLPKGKRPAILTFSAESLTVHHLAAVGIDPQTPVVGMPPTSEFQRSIREGDASVPFEVLKDEVIGVAGRMIEADTSIGAIVCECTNITPYSHELNRRLGVPVFDMVTLVHWFHRALRPERFAQD